jgi:hypothetical protein
LRKSAVQFHFNRRFHVAWPGVWYKCPSTLFQTCAAPCFAAAWAVGAGEKTSDQQLSVVMSMLCDASGRDLFYCAHAYKDKCAKYTPHVYGLQSAAHENQENADQQYWQFTVRQLSGAIATLNWRGSLRVSDIISSLAPSLAVQVYHGSRLLFNGENISASVLSASCCCLEIREWVGGGGGGCSRIQPVGGDSVLGNAEVSGNAHESNRTTAQHLRATSAAAGEPASQLGCIIDEQKIELENLRREKKEELAASSKEISSLRLRVAALENQLDKSQVDAETSSEARLGTRDVTDLPSSFDLKRIIRNATVVSLPQQKKRNRS